MMKLNHNLKLVKVNSSSKVFVRENTPDEHVAKSNLNGEFDIAINLLSKLKTPFYILDLGGYIGTAAIEFARLDYSKVITLEPMDDNFLILKMNTVSFPNIKAVNAAIGNKSGKVMISDRGTGEWGRTIVENPIGISVREIKEVDVLTFEDITQKYLDSSLPIAAVKIDIEGGEKVLLENGDWLETIPIVLQTP